MSGTVSPEWNTHGECGWCKDVAGKAPQCWCGSCHYKYAEAAADSVFEALKFNHMYLCADCGNKRCPRATFHGNECSGSNAPGQVGSVYAS